MRPVNDVILVRPLPKETRTAGGIWLPDTAQERTNRATVVAIGPGVSDPDAAVDRRTPPDVRVDQEVILSRYYGIQDLHTDGGEELETVRFGEIMAVVEPDPPAQPPEVFDGSS
jgi:chaperonin GroES